MEVDREKHRSAAQRHRDAALAHDEAAAFWKERGDEQRSDLQRRLADYERGGARLEDEWAALADAD